jgi:hypothetical protein
MRVVPDDRKSLVDFRTIPADPMYISDVLGAEDDYDRELTPLVERLHNGGLTPDQYEAERSRIAARAVKKIADADDRFVTRHA